MLKTQTKYETVREEDMTLEDRFDELHQLVHEMHESIFDKIRYLTNEMSELHRVVRRQRWEINKIKEGR